MSFDVPEGFLLTDCQSYCTRVADGTHETPTQAEVGKRLATSKNIKDGRLTLENSYLIPVGEFDEINKRSKVDQWDILISMIGTVGEVCLIDTPEPDFAIKNVGLLKCGDQYRGKWLYYYLRAPLAKGLIEARKKGTTQQYISLGEIRRFPVIYPETHDYMSSVVIALSALDDRITLLRETNATLEAIAQALFKSWFVDFDPVRAKQEGRAPEGMDEATAALFPDSFEESALGLVPKGWGVSTFQDCCARTESGGTPKRTVPEYWNGNISWLTSGEVRSPIVFETKEKITDLGVKDSSAKLWPSGTTVIAMYGATAGEVCLLAEPSTANQACCGLIPKQYFRTFLFMSARREQQNLASKSSGSAQQNLNKGLVSGHPVLIPTAEILERYEAIAGTLLNSWSENERQAQTLATLRDTLLPRLISGQLRLPEAEAAVEAVL